MTAPSTLPSEFGAVEESYSGPSGKTIFYIQDAHDSLEAQENIARIIDDLVRRHGVKTVFEEGYEGPVPTDEYFGKIENPETKEKAAYFLMDKLRIGGAEYAHINRHRARGREQGGQSDGPDAAPSVSSPHALGGDPRLRISGMTTDWKLIGADDLALHRKNIAAYRLTASRKEAVSRDIRAMREEMKTLINRHFPPPVKDWVRVKELFDNGQLTLPDYLNRSVPLWKAGGTFEGRYPQLELLVSSGKPDQKTSEDDGGRLGGIDPKRLFTEIENAEEAFAASTLKDEKAKTLFRYVRLLGLLERLFDFRLTFPEYETVRAEIKSFDAKTFAGFLSSYAQKPVFLTRRWETLSRESMKFYEIAQARDQAVGRRLDDFLRDPREKAAVIVFGGFHKEGLRALFREKGFSYELIVPKISGPSERHRQYYKQLMANGRLPFETRRSEEGESPLSVRREMSPMVAKSTSNERMWTVPEDRALLPAIVRVIETHPGLDRAGLSVAMEQSLSAARAEARTGEIDRSKWAALSKNFSVFDDALDRARRKLIRAGDEPLHQTVVRIREAIDAAKNARLERDTVTLNALLKSLEQMVPADERFDGARQALSEAVQTYRDLRVNMPETENVPGLAPGRNENRKGPENFKEALSVWKDRAVDFAGKVLRDFRDLGNVIGHALVWPDITLRWKNRKAKIGDAYFSGTQDLGIFVDYPKRGSRWFYRLRWGAGESVASLERVEVPNDLEASRPGEKNYARYVLDIAAHGDEKNAFVETILSERQSDRKVENQGFKIWFKGRKPWFGNKRVVYVRRLDGAGRNVGKMVLFKPREKGNLRPSEGMNDGGFFANLLAFWKRKLALWGGRLAERFSDLRRAIGYGVVGLGHRLIGNLPPADIRAGDLFGLLGPEEVAKFQNQLNQGKPIWMAEISGRSEMSEDKLRNFLRGLPDDGSLTMLALKVQFPKHTEYRLMIAGAHMIRKDILSLWKGPLTPLGDYEPYALLFDFSELPVRGRRVIRFSNLSLWSAFQRQGIAKKLFTGFARLLEKKCPDTVVSTVTLDPENYQALWMQEFFSSENPRNEEDWRYRLMRETETGDLRYPALANVWVGTVGRREVLPGKGPETFLTDEGQEAEGGEEYFSAQHNVGLYFDIVDPLDSKQIERRWIYRIHWEPGRDTVKFERTEKIARENRLASESYVRHNLKLSEHHDAETAFVDTVSLEGAGGRAIENRRFKLWFETLRTPSGPKRVVHLKRLVPESLDAGNMVLFKPRDPEAPSATAPRSEARSTPFESSTHRAVGPFARRSETRGTLNAWEIYVGDMTKEHVADIFGRMQRLVEYKSLHDDSLEEDEVYGLFRYGVNGVGKGLTAMADGRHVGSLVYKEDDWGYDISLFAVDPQSDARAIIEKLTREMIQKLTDEKPLLRLYVRESNDFARQVFTSLGFDLQLKKNYYEEEDAYEMTFHKKADGGSSAEKEPAGSGPLGSFVRDYNFDKDQPRVAKIETVSRMTPGAVWTKELLDQKRRQSDIQGFVAEVDGTVVGYLFYRSHYREIRTGVGGLRQTELENEIEKFNVHPDFRGRGIEMDLLDRLKDEFRRKNTGAADKTVSLVIPTEVPEEILSHSGQFLRDMDFKADGIARDHFGSGRDGVHMVYRDSEMWARRERFVKLIELMDRNRLLIQGPFSPDGTNSYDYNDHLALMVRSGHADRRAYADLGAFEFEKKKKIAGDILRDRLRIGKFAWMRENRPEDEALLYRLAGHLNLGIDGSAEPQKPRSEAREDITAEDIEEFSGRLNAHQAMTPEQNDSLRKAIETFQTMLAKAGKGEAPSQKEILGSVIETNLTHPYRIEHGLPPTVVFDGAIYRSYTGIPPYRVAVTFGDDFIAVNVVHMGLPDYKDFGAWKDPGVIKYPISEDFDLSAFPISKGGVRWYHEGRKPLQEITFEQKIAGFDDGKKKTTNLLLEAANLSAAMFDKNPPADVFFGGGKTVILTRERADIQKVIFEWVASSITAGALGKFYIAGPDMNTAALMGAIQKASDRVRGDLGLAPIPITTSISDEPASFNHELWTVTSISDIESFLSAWSDPEIRARYGLPEGTPEAPLDIVIQGYGDVGSGIVKYLFDQYGDRLRNGSVRIVAISNINGGLYRPEGLDIGELLRFRNDPDREKMQFFDEYLRGDPAAREGIKRLAKGEDVFYVRELDTEKADERKPLMAFPAAGPNVFNTEEDVKRLREAGVRSLCSAANNVLKEGAGLDKKLEDAGVLFLDARLVSPGGIYASTEEIYHQLTEGIENVRKLMVPSKEDAATPEDPFYKHHIQGGIAELANSVTRWAVEEFKKSLKNGKVKTISAIHQELSELIRGRMNYLLKTPSPALLKRVNRDLERIRVRFDKISAEMTDKAKQDLWNWIARIEILNTVTEIARSRIMYHEDNIPDLAEAIETLLQTPPSGRPHVSIQRALVYNLARMPAYGFWGLFLDIVRNAALDPRVRANAAEALGLLNERKAVGALKVLAEEEGKSFVGSWIRWSLQKIESEDHLTARSEARSRAAYAKRFDWEKMGDLELLGLLKNVRDQLEKMQIRLQEIKWMKSVARPAREPFSLFRTTIKSFLVGLAAGLGARLGLRHAAVHEEKLTEDTARQKEVYAAGLLELAARWQKAGAATPVPDPAQPLLPGELQAFVREAYAVRQGIKNFDLIMRKTSGENSSQRESRKIAFLEYGGKNAVDFLKKMADQPVLGNPSQRNLPALRDLVRRGDAFIGDGLDRFFEAYRNEYAQIRSENRQEKREARIYLDGNEEDEEEDGRHYRVDMETVSEGTAAHFLEQLRKNKLHRHVFLAGTAVQDLIFGTEPKELGVLVAPEFTDEERGVFESLIGPDETFEGIPVAVLGSPLEFQESADNFPDLSVNRLSLMFDALSSDPILNDFTERGHRDLIAKQAHLTGLDAGAMGDLLLAPGLLATVLAKITDWVDQIIDRRLIPSAEMLQLFNEIESEAEGSSLTAPDVTDAFEDYRRYLETLGRGRERRFTRRSAAFLDFERRQNAAIERVVERLDPKGELPERVRINTRLFLFGTVSYAQFKKLFVELMNRDSGAAVDYITTVRQYFNDEMARSEARLPVPRPSAGRQASRERSEARDYDKTVRQWAREKKGSAQVISEDGEVFEFKYEDAGEDDEFVGDRQRIDVIHGQKVIGYVHFRIIRKEAIIYIALDQSIDNSLASFFPEKYAAIRVDEDYRKRYTGIGRTLMGFALRLAKERGVEIFDAIEVRSEKFFKDLGFEIFMEMRWSNGAHAYNNYRYDFKTVKVPLPEFKIALRDPRSESREAGTEMKWPLEDNEARRAVAKLLLHQLRNKIASILSGAELLTYPNFQEAQILTMTAAAENVVTFLKSFSPERPQPFFLTDYMGGSMIATPETQSYGDEYRVLAEAKSPRILNAAQAEKLAELADFRGIEKALVPPAMQLKTKIDALQTKLKQKSVLSPEDIRDLFGPLTSFHTALENVTHALETPRSEMRAGIGGLDDHAAFVEKMTLTQSDRRFSLRGSLAALQTISDKLIVIDFRDMTDPKDPFSEEQIAEMFGLADAAAGKVKIVLHDADVAHQRYGEFKALIEQMERRNPEARGTIALKTESLERLAKTDLAAHRGQVLYLFKNVRSMESADGKILRFRYEDESGRLTRAAGTLGYAVTVADEISKKTADLLKQQLPDGVRFNATGGYYYVDSAHAGIWEKIYSLMYVVAFARSA